MSRLAKIPQLLLTAFLGLIRFGLMTIVLVAILALILFGVSQIILALSRWNGANWLESFFAIVISGVVLASAPLLLFRLFDDHPWAKRAAGWYRPWFDKLAGFAVAVLIAYGVLAFFVVVSGLALALLLYFSGRTVFSTVAAWYLIGTLVTLAYTLFGQKVAQRVQRWIMGTRLKLPWLFYFLRPSLLRVCAYVLLAAAYLVANVETFAGYDLLAWPWWESFRKVIVEVLLTYVAIDGAFTAWRDHREADQGKAGSFK